jgi:adenosine deaminase CECR1
MVGQEDAGYTLKHWLPQLFSMQMKCKEKGLEIPFVFHAGETHNHFGSDADSNLHDAVLLNSKRIGHGFSLSKHPVLQNLCREKGIAIEICPISHEVLGLCSRIATHPIQQLLAAGVPCVIGSDDPGFWK